MFQQTLHNRWLRVLVAGVGTLISAISLNIFIVPQGLYSGGLIGVCQLIRNLLQAHMNVRFFGADLAGILYFVFNNPLLLFTGRALGKHKLAPEVSPHKTVEGAVGGVLGSVILALALTAVYGDIANRVEAFTAGFIGPELYFLLAILAAFSSVLGILGDLFASAVKRQCGIKDYGTIFPGHGGILDRFDSVMFIAPFVTSCVTAVFYALRK